ncbi:hypothetical protein OAK55_01365 [Akkermansiaceae bacterium]|nr:hypothetical protein [Akkermansiaceae bacterium]
MLSVTAICVMLLMSGCTPTLRPTKLPYFLEKAKEQTWTEDQKQTVGEMLHYINDLENNAR